MTNITDVTRRCFDRTSDSISIRMSVFLAISVIAVSSARMKIDRPSFSPVHGMLESIGYRKGLHSFSVLRDIAKTIANPWQSKNISK
jgi:hypothetical protein